MSWRAWLYKMHRWIGLSVGVLLFFQGCTGATIAFRNELNRALHFDALNVTPAARSYPLQASMDLVRARHPDLQIRSVDVPHRAGQAALFRLESPDGRAMRYVAVDPVRLEVTRDAPLIAWPVLWSLEWHKTMLLGQRAKVLIGIEALCLLALAIIGPILWWPGRRNLKRGFKMKLDAGFNRGVRELHRVGGVIVALLLMTTAVTGTLIIFRATFESVVSSFTPVEPRPWPIVEKPAGRELLPVDAIIDEARGHYPDAPIVALRFPFADTSVITTYAPPANTDRPRATDQAWFNGYTAELLATRNAAALSPANTFFEWIVPVHSGQALGIGGRIAFFLAGISLAVLVASGFLQWNARRVQKRRPVAQVAA